MAALQVAVKYEVRRISLYLSQAHKSMKLTNEVCIWLGLTKSKIYQNNSDINKNKK